MFARQAMEIMRQNYKNGSQKTVKIVVFLIQDRSLLSLLFLVMLIILLLNTDFANVISHAKMSCKTPLNALVYSV